VIFTHFALRRILFIGQRLLLGVAAALPTTYRLTRLLWRHALGSVCSYGSGQLRFWRPAYH